MAVTTSRSPEGSTRSRSWRWTAITGVALLALVTIHMVAHHFVVDSIGGLRTYQQVLDYIDTPIIFVIEGVFLVVVTAHAMLGLRSVLLDFGLSERWRAAAGTEPHRPRRRDGRVRLRADRRAGLEGLRRPADVVGIVIVSHSHRIAEGVAELAREMGGDEVKLETAGGLERGRWP